MLKLRHGSLAAMAAALAISGAGPAFAQDHPKPPTDAELAARFERADANEDGKLTKAEFAANLFAARLPEQAATLAFERLWSRLDSEKKGWVTEEEYLKNYPIKRPQ